MSAHPPSPPSHPLTPSPSELGLPPAPLAPLPKLADTLSRPPIATRPSAVSINGRSAPAPSAAPNGRKEGSARTDTTHVVHDWDAAWDDRRRKGWADKVQKDLKGWRGGHGPPRSAYSRTAVPVDSYFGQPPTGVVGRHLPKEVIRIEREWAEGEVCQFESIFPMELEGRITPAVFQAFIADINAHLTEAYSVRGAVLDNLIAVGTWWTSLLWRTSHFERHLRLVEDVISQANRDTFEPVGLRVLSPRHVALQFLEIEYY